MVLMSKLITTIKLPTATATRVFGVAFFAFIAGASLFFMTISELNYLLVVCGDLFILCLFVFSLKLTFNGTPTALNIYDDYLEFVIKNGNKKILIKDISEISYIRMRTSTYSGSSPIPSLRQLVIKYLDKKEAIDLPVKDISRVQEEGELESDFQILIDTLSKFNHIKLNLVHKDPSDIWQWDYSWMKKKQ